MDKQQATEIFNKLDLACLSPEELIIAGWEAREAQLFTREQVEAIAKFCMVKAKTGELKNFSDFLSYLETNYPLK